MAFEAKILADSVNPDGVRLTTMCVTYPLIIHGELMTHRKFSRNAASNRAIPLSKMIERVKEEPFVPIHWGKAQKGMQAYEELEHHERVQCIAHWQLAKEHAIAAAECLNQLGLHKQIGNRLLAPFQWITLVISSTDWEHFFHLRCNHDVEPHMQRIAYMMRDEYDRGKPRQAHWGDWHLPYTGYVGDEALDIEQLKKVSVARCARVSYLTHEGRREVSKDLELHDMLVESGHWSPFEHVAQAVCPSRAGSMPGFEIHLCQDWGNFNPGWLQYRKCFPQEHIKVRTR